MADEPDRSRAARQAAERALIRVVHHYGTRPEFVVLGGLVPELLCSASAYAHAGTTDVDVQVNLEIAAGSVNAARLEVALRNAEFEPDHERIWRCRADGTEAVAEIKFELLADLDEERAGVTVVFDGCDALGAANLRGTGFAVRDVEVHRLRARVGGVIQEADINVTGLAGFLLAKAAASHSRDASRKTGMTSPTCCYTTTPAARDRRPNVSGAASTPTSPGSERRSTTSVTTSPIRWRRALRRTPTASISIIPSKVTTHSRSRPSLLSMTSTTRS